ncbi:MAG: DUF420 domain-containing protein [Verrucomicrobiia bacterium]|tara:strand:+ start:6131 stop:6565 length:435 start_codon:yes stop_codon:yes gene_type:complete
MSVGDIPGINACLNGLSTVLMTLGFIFIKRGDKETHRKLMLSAGTVSAVFLIGYVSHKVMVRGVHTVFGGEGAIRSVYYAMLISHIILAISIAYLVPRTFWFAIKGDFERHKKWAKWTFPIWYYVSVTGVLVYLFLYQWWPSAA